MKGCISMSLYGDGAKYAFGAIENARLAPKLYPGWTLIIHAQKEHYAIPKLTKLGAVVVEYDSLPGSGGMFWRFLSADSSEFTHTIIRDADSRLNVREVAATQAWIKSGKSLHVMRDNDWHLNRSILGGAWGIKNGAFKTFAEEVKKWKHSYSYGDDESFLDQKVWSFFYPQKDFIRHSFVIGSNDDTAFPDHSKYAGFIGEQIHPEFTEKFKAVVLSPERYKKRREKFFNSVNTYGGFLKNKVEWYKAKTSVERYVPSVVDHAEAHPHYYLAGRDHLDILEQAILDGTEFLFVFEDDAIFHPDFEEFFLRAWIAVPDNWKAIMLGGSPWTDSSREYVSSNTALSLARVRGCLGMHGIFWNRLGMIRAFDHFTYWNKMVIDQAFKGLQCDEPNFYAPARWVVEVDPEAKQYGLDE